MEGYVDSAFAKKETLSDTAGQEDPGNRGATASAVRIAVDAREGELRTALEAVVERECVCPRRGGADIIEHGSLDVGDVRVTDAGERVVILVERKTVADLAASVKDGRYREQKARMLNTETRARERTHVYVYVYVIEGYSSFAALSDAAQCFHLAPSTLQSCVHGCMLREGIHVVFTRDVSDTAAYLSSLARYVARHTDALASTPEHASSAVSASASAGERSVQSALVASAVSSKRSGNITRETCYLMQLCQLPGVSETNARALAQRWPTFKALFSELAPLQRAEQVRRLMRTPGIGKKSAETLVAVLLD